jgi:hypothetical protein
MVILFKSFTKITVPHYLFRRNTFDLFKRAKSSKSEHSDHELK